MIRQIAAVPANRHAGPRHRDIEALNLPHADTTCCVVRVSPHNLAYLSLVGQRIYSLNVEVF